MLGTRIRRSLWLNGEFTFRSGQVSTTYFDKYLLESDPVLLKDIAQHTGGPCAIEHRDSGGA